MKLLHSFTHTTTLLLLIKCLHISARPQSYNPFAKGSTSLDSSYALGNQPESDAEPEPNSEPEFTDQAKYVNDPNNGEKFYKAYESQTHNFNPDQHIISVSKDMSNQQFERVNEILLQKSMKGRSFDDFVKMTFWSAVLSEQPDGHEFNDVHEISLADSTHWWKSNFVNHGCYCWPEQEERLMNFTNPNNLIDSQKISGFGQPTDPLDEECFDLYSCYRCVSLMPECREVDWVTSHYDCQFISTVKNNDGTNSTRLELRCNDEDPCMQSLCECDKKFALAAKDKLLTKQEKNSKIFPDGCPRKGHEDSAKKCCGSWPNVKPYPINEKCCAQTHYGGWEIANIGDAVCEILAEDEHPTWEQLYQGSEVTLNFKNPNITEHDHNGSHEFADHIHPVSG